MIFVFFKQKTAYEMRISDWSSDVCSSDLAAHAVELLHAGRARARRHLRDAGLQRAAHRATGVAHRDRGPGPGALERRPRRTEHAAAARTGLAPAPAPFAPRLPPALCPAVDRHPRRAQRPHRTSVV